MSDYRLIATNCTIGVTLDDDNAAKRIAVFLKNELEPAIIIDARLIRTALIASFEHGDLDDDGSDPFMDETSQRENDDREREMKDTGVE